MLELVVMAFRVDLMGEQLGWGLEGFATSSTMLKVPIASKATNALLFVRNLLRDQC